MTVPLQYIFARGFLEVPEEIGEIAVRNRPRRRCKSCEIVRGGGANRMRMRDRRTTGEWPVSSFSWRRTIRQAEGSLTPRWYEYSAWLALRNIMAMILSTIYQVWYVSVVDKASG